MTNEEFLFEVRLHRVITESKLKQSQKLMSEGFRVNELVLERYKYDVLACRLVEGLADDLAKSGKLMEFNDHMDEFLAKLPKVQGKGAADFVKQAGIFQKISAKLKTMFSKSSLSDAVGKFYSTYPFYFDVRMASNRLSDVERDELSTEIKKLPVSANSKKYLLGAWQDGVMEDVVKLGQSDNPGPDFQKYLPTAGQMTSGEAMKKFFSLGGDIVDAAKTTGQAAVAGVKAVAGAAPEVAKGVAKTVTGNIGALPGKAGEEAGTPAGGEEGGLAGAEKGAEEETKAAGGSIPADITDKTPDEDVKAILGKLVNAKGADAITKMMAALKDEELEADRQRLMGGGIDESVLFNRLIEMSVRRR